MHLDIGFNKYVMNPQVRVNMFARSPSVEVLREKLNEPYRVVGFNGTLFPGYSGSLGLEGVNGPDALINIYYRELYEHAGFEKQWGWLIFTTHETFSDTKPIYDMWNVRFFLETPLENHDLPIAGLIRVGRYDLDIYENPEAWPRSFFVGNVLTYSGVREFVDLVKNNSGKPFAALEESVLNTHPELQLCSSPHNRDGGFVPGYDYKLTNNTTAFTIDAPGKGIVILSEAYLEGDFHAEVNGAAVNYFRVNHVFKGVLIPQAGIYRISFSYWPRHLTVSLVMSACGIVLLAAWFIWVARKHGT